MKAFLLTFKESFNIIKQDKWILIFCLIPVLIGALLYMGLGGWMFASVLPWGSELIKQHLSSGFLGDFLTWVLGSLLSIAFFFLMNWTFVLIVSLVASPFNDIISGRVERSLRGKEQEAASESFNAIFGKLFTIIFNESKKILLIFIVSVIVFLMGFVPLLVPVSILLSSLLLAANFLDYSWSRHDLPFKACLQGIKSNLFINILAGLSFLGLLSIHIINLFSLPFAVVYFTILFTKNYDFEQTVISNNEMTSQ